MAKEKILKDPKGREIPFHYLSDDRKRKERLLDKVFDRVYKLSKKMKKDKEKINEEINKYMQYLQEKYKTKSVWDSTSLVNFSDTKKIEIQMHSYMQCDEKLNLAKEKLEELIEKWGASADPRIVIILRQAFQTSSGSLSVPGLLNLRNLNLPDPEWKNIQELITSSLFVHNKKRYVSFKQKDDAGAWKQIILNYSRLADE